MFRLSLGWGEVEGGFVSSGLTQAVTPPGLSSGHTPVESRGKALTSRAEGGGGTGFSRNRTKGTTMISPKADPESRIWVQEVYLGGEPRKHLRE